jgi:hypothetical protein
VTYDPMHIWFLGVGRDLNAAGLGCLKDVYMPGTDLFGLYVQYCRETRTPLPSARKFLIVDSSLHCKAADTLYIGRWLGSVLGDMLEAPYIALHKMLPLVCLREISAFAKPVGDANQSIRLVALAARLSKLFWDLCEGAQEWLTEYERQVALTLGESLVATLHVLGKSVLRLKPKAHYFCHLVLDLKNSPARNPWWGCCWRDEDFIGKFMTLVKSSHARSISHRPMEFYCARLPLLLR